MSGIGKVFKKILKVVAIVATVVVAAAAVIFTAGAALGAVGVISTSSVLGGGLAGAASGLVGALGISTTGVLGAALTGAITYAGYGAVAGGAIAAITGKPILKGAMQGAAIGAIGGGVLGAAGIISPAAPTWGPASAPGGGVLPSSAAMGPGGAEAATNPTGAYVPPGAVTSQPLPPPGAAPPPVAANGGLVPAAAAKAGWLERNPYLAGQLLQGVGGAIEGDPTAEAQRERDLRFAQNYSTSGGLITPMSTGYLDALGGLKSPGQQFAPAITPASAPSYGFRYEYDPTQRKITKVPVQAPKA